jgi:hypothetical protein
VGRSNSRKRGPKKSQAESKLKIEISGCAVRKKGTGGKRGHPVPVLVVLGLWVE